MKAIQFSEFSKEGDFSVLKMNLVAKPALAAQPSSALIKIHAASINPVDTYVKLKFFTVTLPETNHIS
jgi:NADPH:quinone reductase-like Zn-dependent oxidoreductase